MRHADMYMNSTLFTVLKTIQISPQLLKTFSFSHKVQLCGFKNCYIADKLTNQLECHLEKIASEVKLISLACY